MKSKNIKYVRVSILLPDELVAELDRIAAREGRNRSAQVRFFLARIVSRQDTASVKG